MPNRGIGGTAGHIDHGKSALGGPLTGIDPDRLKEEKERGITIELGFAHLLLPSGTLAGIIDVPGHEKFVRTMGAGAAGDEVQVLPGGPVARVRGLQVHGGQAESSSAGTRTAVNLQGVEKESVPRGSVLCHTGTFSPTMAADAWLEYLPLAPRPLKNRARASFHAGTSTSLAKVLLYGAAEIPPGGSGYARIELDEEIVLAGGDRFILRGFSPLENFGYTIGGGRILSPCPPRRRGTAKAGPQAPPPLRSPDPAARVLAAFEEAGRKGLGIKEAAVIAGVGLAAAQGRIERLLSSEKIRADAGGSRRWHSATVEETGTEGIRE